MKFQWTLLLGITFALIVAVFAVINVDPVTVNYFFGQAEWPLILVILGSVLMGGIIIGSVGLFRLYVLQRKLKALEKENLLLKEQAEKSHADKKKDVSMKKHAPDSIGETGE
jgi:lipopolysaccharide assembly protein A